MCTAIILDGVSRDHRVVIAANRDELYARPAEGPVLLMTRPRAAGGLDAERGGSWLGVTEVGFLALLTNQPPVEGARTAPRSRGEVVVEVLRRGERAAAAAYLDQLDASDYNPFNLLFGDASGLEVAYCRDSVEREPVPRGLSVLPNGRLDEPRHRKVARARELMAPHLAAPWPELGARLATALADHRRPDLDEVAATPRFSRQLMRELQAICIHAPDYGTRSAALIALDPGRVGRFLWAPGPPCTTAFADARYLLFRDGSATSL